MATGFWLKKAAIAAETQQQHQSLSPRWTLGIPSESRAHKLNMYPH